MEYHKTLLPGLAALALLLGTTACQNTVNTFENEDKTARTNSIPTDRFVSDRFCRDRIKVIGFNRARTEAGLETLQVTLRSERYGFWSELWSDIMGANPYYVEYKVDWLDSRGMNVSSPASGVWMNVIFIPGETKFLTAVAPTPDCHDFLFNLRESTNY